MDEKRNVNIEDFFTVDNEKEGIWFEPRINNIPCGIEFLVTGKGTDENIARSERFEKKVSELQKIKDPEERIAAIKKADAERVAEFVKGVRAAEGCNTMFGGKPLEYSVPLVQKIMLKSPLIKDEITDFASNTVNFIKREKNA